MINHAGSFGIVRPQTVDVLLPATGAEGARLNYGEKPVILEDGLEEYNMDIPLMSLTETLAENLED